MKNDAVEKYGLEDKMVTVFLVGPHEFTGVVEHSDKEKLVLIGQDGPFVIYKDKIVAAMIIDETKLKKLSEVVSSEEYGSLRGENLLPEAVQEHSHYGSVIPEDMLIGDSNEPEVSFSLSMSSLKNPSINKNGDVNGSKEKIRSNNEKGAK